MRAMAGTFCVLAATLACAAPAEAKARFAVTGVDASPQTLSTGAELHAAIDVRKSGGGSKRARVRILLRAAAGEIPLGSLQSKRRSGNRGYDFAASVPDVAAGDYEVVACVRKYGKRGPNRCGSDEVAISGLGGSTTTPPPLTTTPPATFTPGARTLGDPLLPQLGNGGYDAMHYDVALDYDPAANVFDSATTTVQATATQDLSQLSLDFQDLPVDRVLVDGATAGFSQADATPALAGGGTQPMKLVVDPPAGIAAGSTFTVAVEYHGAPQVLTDPDGSDEGWIRNPSCPAPAPCSYFVVGEPMGSQAWFPSNNHPSDKAAFDTTVTVPTGQTAVGVGELVGQVANGDGTTTWHWREDSPTSTYLVTASNAPTSAPGGFQQSTIAEALSGRTLPIYDMVAPSALPSRVPAITNLTARNAEMIDALGDHYGPYPLDSYGSVWDINPSVGYALEVQTKSHFSSVVGASTYLHELAHQWWGDAVSPHDWNDLWFNEGWAVLSEWIFAFESGASPDSPETRFDNEYAGASPTDWSVAPAVLDNDPAKMFSPSFPTYTRGSMTLEGFREIIGPAAFDDFARDLQTQFAHGTIDTPQFIAFAKQSSGFSGAQLARLDDYFQQWLYGTTKPTITPDNF